MKNIRILIAITSLALVINGCYYDEEILEGDGGVPTNVSLVNDVQPIFDLNCNKSGCHDAAPSHDPSLVKENAYLALKQGGYINTTVAEQSVLYQVIAEGNMPPSGALAQKDLNIILGWIREGAKNN